MYKKVDNSKSFSQMEDDVIEFWKQNGIEQKNFDMNKGKKHFSFYDGPPTANGMPHIGHIETRVIKDIIPRYKVMKGYHVVRKAGWDTHGLPVELEIEKKLGISGKEQIEEYGVEKFTKECKESVFKYTKEWEQITNKVGFWLDMDNPYITYDNNYIESVWWAIKELDKKGLLYKGHKVMPYCPRCGTALSSHEVAQGYKDVTDTTCTVKFELEDKENTYILAWTTTPWTLPSNLALAVNSSFDYVCVKQKENDEKYIVAKELVSKVFGDEEVEILEEFKGSELVGKKYKQFLPFAKVEGKAFVVIHGDFVSMDEGTGIVHLAPAYGEDDARVSKENDIAFVNLVDKNGKFVDDVTLWKGEDVRCASDKIVKYLEEQGKLFSKAKHKHSYPHCWRCDTPLLYYPKEGWFVAMQKLRDELIANNQKVNWYPDNIKNGRFGKFLENVIDWGISRDRYWGTPLPVWVCEKCGKTHTIGSREELEKNAIGDAKNVELHKPYIDEIKLKCSCGGEMTREKEVIDCWFDSGSMPFAQWHYPFENKEMFEENFPANYITEAVDQTRGWFYTLTALGTALFGRTPFENCIVLGHVLDEHGQKMSKSKKNGVDPMELLSVAGSDATRWHFYTVNAPWLPKRLGIESVKETQRGFLSTLWNVYSFYILYAQIDNFDPTKYEDFKSDNIMDKWIISKLNSLVKLVDEKLENYDITNAAIAIEDFTDELSNWYVRRNRERFWAKDMAEDKVGAFVTLYRVLKTLIQISAPFVPFMTETIYQNVVRSVDKNANESVHLNYWPKVDETKIDKELEMQMDLAYEIVKYGRSARNKENIKNRQPLQKLRISTNLLDEYYLKIIKEELNVKEIEANSNMSDYVHFDIKPNLPVLGKQFGKLIPKIKEEIAKLDQMELANKILDGKEQLIYVDEQEIVLDKENVLVTMQGKKGHAFAGSGTVGVVLDTELTEELINEGYIRELLSKIQNMRKDNGYEVLDKIHIYVLAPKELETLIKENETQIKKDTLALSITYNEKAKYELVNINGLSVQLMLEKAQ